MRSVAVALCALVIFTSACERRSRGPMERTGERLDEMGENVSEGRSPLHRKGTMEELGEDIDEATGARTRR